jgi:hypothetical protein
MGCLRIFVMTATALLPSASIAQECAPPPVVTSEHAICIGRRYFAKAPSPGKLGCEAKEHDKLWLVRCMPESSNVRGGGGELEVDRTSGKVKLVLGYR